MSWRSGLFLNLVLLVLVLAPRFAMAGPQLHEELDRVFGVFQRGRESRNCEGTGIGLAVCRKIADRHHGSIRVESEIGVGSTFVVELPLRQPGGAQGQEEAT